MRSLCRIAVVIVSAYVAFSWISSNFNPLLWDKSDKIMCSIVVAVISVAVSVAHTEKEKE